MRYASERWYTEKFNVALASPESYDRRRKILIGLIEGAEAFVFDISGISAAKALLQRRVQPNASPI